MKTIVYSVIALLLMSFAMATEVDVAMDVPSGTIDITAEDDLGTDEEAMTRFVGIGNFEGTFNANDNGVDGIMDTLIGVNAKGTNWARFDFLSSHNLGSSNHNDNKMVLTSWVDGESATMDMGIANSASQSQAERVSGRAMLSAQDTTQIGYDMGYIMTNSKRDNTYTNAIIDVGLFGIGGGSLGKTIYGSNHLARGIGYNSNALDVRDGEVVATGDGVFTQYGFGDNSLEMNGFNLGSGFATFTANFVNGFSGNYNTRAR